MKNRVAYKKSFLAKVWLSPDIKSKHFYIFLQESQKILKNRSEAQRIFFPYMVRRQPDGPEATCNGPELTLMVRWQQVLLW